MSITANGISFLRPLSLIVCVVAFFPLRQLTHMIPLATVCYVLLFVSILLSSYKSLRDLYFLLVIFLLSRLASHIAHFNFSTEVTTITVLTFVYYLIFYRNLLKEWFDLNFRTSWLKYFVAYSLISAAALALWTYYFREELITQKMPDAGIVPLISLGLLFSLVNAFYEEFFFRGCLFNALMNVTNSRNALLIQAIAFTGIHYLTGFPFGLIGSAIAFVYGLLMGHLFLKARSLVPCIVSHTLCDTTIFIIALKLNGLL